MKIQYVPKKFNPVHQSIIDHANSIIQTYAAAGYDLTLRQLYYQFISRDLFPEAWQDATTGSTNNQRSYDKLGGIISDARRAGLIDWDRIVDRTRNVHFHNTWAGPNSIIQAVAQQFDVDLWENQSHRPEVWVEKDALIGVLEVACGPWQVPYFSCRGYTSDSEIWSAAQRLARHDKNGQIPVVIHLGDHDPSGIDMSRDIEDRLKLFARRDIEVRRIALNMEQVEELQPPPNPAKTTDCRYEKYRDRFGEESWELDALEPDYITRIINEQMEGLITQTEWDAATERREEGRRQLGDIAGNWDDVVEFLGG